MSSKSDDEKISPPKKGKKTGPKGSYAVKKVVDRMSEEEKSEFRRKYYIYHVPKYKLGKEIGLSHQLVNKLIEALGPLQPSDLPS